MVADRLACRAVCIVVLAACASFSESLRVAEQPAAATLSRTTSQERAAREAGTCGKDVMPLDLARREGVQADCDELIPRYDMAEWVKTHGYVVPDHPAVFINTGTHEAEVFPSMEAFLEQHGDETVTALPEYAQSGGHLKDPKANGAVNASFRTLAQVWNETFVYFSDFKCNEGSLCDASSRQFGAPPLFASVSFRSKNFLVGGPDSGLPFHKHGMTWQGLSMGRKAWYLLPPGTMTEQLHDVTGPYLFPVRAYHGVMVGKKVGQRPLYCVQHPGEVLYVPDFWWHSTMNLDKFQVAYGEKPSDKKQQDPRSDVLSRILVAFPQQAWDSAGYTDQMAGGASGGENPMPYAVYPRKLAVMATCGATMQSPAYSLDEPLRRMKAAASAGSPIMTCGAAETAAFAHCQLAKSAEALMRKRECSLSADFHQAMKDFAKRWRTEAGLISPALVAREHKICH